MTFQKADQKTGGKKLFTAELQRLKQKALAGEDSHVKAVTGGATISPDLEAALTEMRADLKLIEGYLRPDDHLAPPKEPSPDEVVPANLLEAKRAEVSMLKTELRALAVCIEQTKLEIAALRPQQADEDRIVAVTFELDAIVSSTERATDVILESSEKIDRLASVIAAQKDGHSSRLAEEISDHVVAIFEACNFQDITGQRITKVVNTLKYIEDRLNRMVDIWGVENLTDLPLPIEVNEDEEAKLLNGPQLENKGISQSEIDALFG